MRTSSRSGAAARKAIPALVGKSPAPPPPPAPETSGGKTGLTSLNRLHCFEVVVEESGFKRATSRLHITQPALSYQMKHLEEELGVQLFLRRPGGVSLTDAGRLLYAHVQRVSAVVRRAEQAVKELPAVGEVRIGTVNSIGTYFLPHVLAAVHERHSATIPILYRARSDDHIEALLANQVDLAILADPRLDKRLRYETLFEERVSLVSSRAHPLFGVQRLRPEQLHGAPMVALSPQTPTGALVQKYLERLGVRVEPVVSTEDVLTVKRMVEMGIGAAFLPDMVTHREVVGKANPGGRLFRSELDVPLTRRVVLVTWDEVPSSRAVAAVVDEVRRQSVTWGGAPANANG
ncbi:MAG TPA: LysR family transcriptional regulator [Anaeromyxobacter sp.]|nr:LysR family transcriptional regulator [Anaeromyxobacter sp.]